jgi:hypothetical protein
MTSIDHQPHAYIKLFVAVLKIHSMQNPGSVNNVRPADGPQVLFEEMGAFYETASDIDCQRFAGFAE